ncbi:MAG: glycosyltransferase family 4 protein [Sphingobacteriales bacterium]|nr:glycosyltransferase family 4 protein [Sphingobacteriales bacterium]
MAPRKVAYGRYWMEIPQHSMKGIMKIAFIVEFPTQFEVPFYQYVNERLKAESLRLKAEGGRRKAEGGRQKAEGGRQKAMGFDSSFDSSFDSAQEDMAQEDRLVQGRVDLSSCRGDGDFEFHVIYNYTDQQDYHDVELGKEVGWGFNLYEGYRYFIADKKDIIRSVSDLLDREKYDFIILNGYKNTYQGLAEACKGRNIPIALRIDAVGYHLSPLRFLLRRLYLPYAYRHFDHFFAVGSETRKYLRRLGIADKRIHYFSYATDDAWFAKQSQDREAIQSIKAQWGIKAEKIILSVAKFVPRESPWDLIKAFIALNDPSLALVLVGDGAERTDLENFTQPYPHLAIHFTGYVPYPQLPFYYGMSTIFVHPAQHEPWGVSVQEALACGCTVIASDKVGAAVDLIQEGANGFIYPYGNSSALSSQIIQCLDLTESILKSSTDAILKKWNYAAMWEEIQQAAINCTRK